MIIIGWSLLGGSIELEKGSCFMSKREVIKVFSICKYTLHHFAGEIAIEKSKFNRYHN